ncbi:protein of unknown function [Melghirimyces thermohalophilus]|uniref:DUF4253 domain-containing protein n=1 Tax=Melghirimyces thermohalophilus TaxID=1236220 RepID=A0A1G6Q5K0_9BACL|nr:DUF4253 domain-containing protein [Melghirimyces thermohalophilus]SDC87016.1 protein of unknown function [Melghirimyces thermohalophilus]
MSMKEAGNLLSRVTGKELRFYSTYDFGRQKDENNLSVIIDDEEEARNLVLNIRPELSEGLVTFVGTTKWYGDERHSGVELVIGEGDSQFDILRLARTDALNYGMETEDLIQRLKEIQEQHQIQIQIFQAESDTLWFDLNGHIGDLSGLCEDLYDFCPDVVDQNLGSMEDLEAFVEVMRQVYLWWD